MINLLIKNNNSKVDFLFLENKRTTIIKTDKTLKHRLFAGISIAKDNLKNKKTTGFFLSSNIPNIPQTKTSPDTCLFYNFL